MIDRNTEKGFAMVLSLVLLLAMSLMGGALIVISSGDHQSNNNSDQYQQTFYAAEMALLQGEKYILNEKVGPWDLRSNTRDTSSANLPEKHTSPYLGKMTTKNYNPGSKYKFTNTKDRKFIDTKDLCFKSFRDIDRDNPKKENRFRTIYSTKAKAEVAHSYNLGVILENTFKSRGEDYEKEEAKRMKSYYYEYFIERIGAASTQSIGSSIKLNATDASKNGIAFRVYGCGIYGAEKEKDRMIVSLESVVVLPKN